MIRFLSSLNHFLHRMLEVGQKPVVLSREIEGFALNRIQYALLNECWRLINDGILDVKDIDSVMSDGLGMRYAFLGPMETTHLNAEGKCRYSFKATLFKTLLKVSAIIASATQRRCTKSVRRWGQHHE